MPTERFLKLKEEKKRRILDAAFREFSRVPFREASINRIIKDAEISRGSFYTYFEDKTDLLQILLRDGSKSLTEELSRELEASDGDYFKALDGTFFWFREKLGLEDNMAVSFIRNTLCNEEAFRDATGGFIGDTTDSQTDLMSDYLYKLNVIYDADYGDILYHLSGEDENHCGIYLGDGQVISASQTAGKVKIKTYEDWSNYWEYGCKAAAYCYDQQH